MLLAASLMSLKKNQSFKSRKASQIVATTSNNNFETRNRTIFQRVAQPVEKQEPRRVEDAWPPQPLELVSGATNASPNFKITVYACVNACEIIEETEGRDRKRDRQTDRQRQRQRQNRLCEDV